MESVHSGGSKWIKGAIAETKTSFESVKPRRSERALIGTILDEQATTTSHVSPHDSMACLTVVPARIAAASAAPHLRIRARSPAEPAGRSLSRLGLSRSVRVRATEDETEDAETMEARVSGAMQEFADAGFPSDEGDAQDPVSRTKAMNGAVEDLNTLMDAEVEVLGKAFDLLEQLGIEGLEKPPSREAADDAEDPAA